MVSECVWAQITFLTKGQSFLHIWFKHSELKMHEEFYLIECLSWLCIIMILNWVSVETTKHWIKLDFQLHQLRISSRVRYWFAQVCIHFDGGVLSGDGKLTLFKLLLNLSYEGFMKLNQVWFVAEETKTWKVRVAFCH